MRNKTICFIGVLFTLIVILQMTVQYASPAFELTEPTESARSIFTPEEREWLEAHPVITVAPDPNYAPVEFYEDGQFKGLSVDYINWISTTYEIELTSFIMKLRQTSFPI